nr:ribosome maturation factor RimM [Bacillus fonticola]
MKSWKFAAESEVKMEWFNVGKIVNTHGIRGEVRVVSRTDFADERYEVGNVLTVFPAGSKEGRELTVRTHRQHKQFDLLTFEEISSVEEAEKVKGSVVKVHKDQLHSLEEGSFYFHEIIGCTVKTVEGETIGKVKEILTPGANDVWVVQRQGKKDAYIPYIDEVVERISIQDQEILISPMEGLLDE